MARPPKLPSQTWKTFLRNHAESVGEAVRSIVCDTIQLRDELLNGEIFYTLQEAKVVIEGWRRHYNSASQHPPVYVIEEKRLC